MVWYETAVVFNRPGVAGAGLQTPPLLIHSFVHQLIKWPVSSGSSKHQYTQTVRAKELKLLENVHPPPCVTSQVSGVKY